MEVSVDREEVEIEVEVEVQCVGRSRLPQIDNR